MQFPLKGIYLKSFFLLICLGLCWGTGFSIAKFAMESGITPLGYSFWQSFGPAIFILFVTLFKEKSFPSFKLKHNLFYFICGILGIVLPNLTIYFSATHVPSGILGLIVNTSPIITYVLSIFFLLEKFSLNRFFGIIFGFFGLVILFYPKLSNYSNFKWMLFALITPLLLASCTIFMVKLRPTNSSSLALSSGMLLASSLIIAPVTFITGNFHVIRLPLDLPNFFIIFEIILSSIGYVVFFELLKIAGPVYYSLVGCIVAIVGLFWGFIIFNEKINLLEWISVVFIILSIYMVSFHRQKA
ncbi:DMT family transporter [Fluviispira multicolorata]|uniref:EamA family transporter n=1 Tax=Fluviispira multicolorata TaxID=2654512 RepID=A0A833N4S0_9BACT|nr:DMT family transporter [Fluviispira multicolorata]KAB8031086.1 EamA family transporter [Fluviispira multicolorata]